MTTPDAWGWPFDEKAALPESSAGLGGPLPPGAARNSFHPGALVTGGLWAAAHGLRKLAAYDFALLALLFFPPLFSMLQPPTFVGNLLTKFLLGAWFIVSLPALVALIVLRIVMALHAYQWAWQFGAYRSLREFRRAQFWWSLGALLALVAALFLAAYIAFAGGGPGLDPSCST